MSIFENFFNTSGPEKKISPEDRKNGGNNEYVSQSAPAEIPEPLKDSDIYYENPLPEADDLEKIKSVFYKEPEK